MCRELAGVFHGGAMVRISRLTMGVKKSNPSSGTLSVEKACLVSVELNAANDLKALIQTESAFCCEEHAIR